MRPCVEDPRESVDCLRMLRGLRGPFLHVPVHRVRSLEVRGEGRGGFGVEGSPLPRWNPTGISLWIHIDTGDLRKHHHRLMASKKRVPRHRSTHRSDNCIHNQYVGQLKGVGLAKALRRARFWLCSLDCGRGYSCYRAAQNSPSRLHADLKQYFTLPDDCARLLIVHLKSLTAFICRHLDRDVVRCPESAWLLARRVSQPAVDRSNGVVITYRHIIRRNNHFRTSTSPNF